MATITDPGYPTLINMVNRLKPDGGVEVNLANTLTKKMPMLKDIPWVEGNLPTGHRIVSANGLPSPTYRKLNQGLAPTKGSTLPFDETCAMLEAYSKIDVDLAKLNGNESAFRATEDKLIIEAFDQQLATSLFYEDVTLTQERFHGLSARYPATTGYTTSSYVAKGTNSGSNCQSIWLISWDPEKVFGIFPKASVGGLQHTDMGIQLVPDASNNQMRAYVSHFQWKMGIAVKDYRYATRYQWDPDDANFASTAKGIYNAMVGMLTTVYELLPTARFYMSRTGFNLLQQQLLNNSLNAGQYVADGAERVMEFMGVPVRFTDSLVQENAIS